MSPLLAAGIILGYFLLLIGISLRTGRDDSNAAFFTARRSSPWPVVAFGMVGASLSGVTFISVPGWVASNQFSYLQFVAGNFLGYLVIAHVLLPLYYRLNLTSIYGYLETRFGSRSHRTGAGFFLLSRLIGSAFRLYLVALVLHLAIFSALGLPFWISVLGTVLLIWVYTFRGGIRTIIWTDTVQTAALLLAVVTTLWTMKAQLGWSIGELVDHVRTSGYSQWLFLDDWRDPRFLPKQVLAGMFITIAMAGLDQDMMQKNLTCRSLAAAQRNMFCFSVVFAGASLLFLCLGAVLYHFAAQIGLDPAVTGDRLYPTLALGGHLGTVAAVLFVVGLVAAAYSSADSALTALTTSFCVDFLRMDRTAGTSDKRTRQLVHLGVTLALALLIIAFGALDNASIIQKVFEVAGYTYGPLLGLYAFGLGTRRLVRDRLVPVVCLLSPVLTWMFKAHSAALLGGYVPGFELLLINAAFTCAGLWLVSRAAEPASSPAGVSAGG
ncbi:MAG TPA: sodium:solute symporter [Opitutaceae bacterium]|nr:sodium:solute symporter [Opitutaceae bacterium]